MKVLVTGYRVVIQADVEGVRVAVGVLTDIEGFGQLLLGGARMKQPMGGVWRPSDGNDEIGV